MITKIPLFRAGTSRRCTGDQVTQVVYIDHQVPLFVLRDRTTLQLHSPLPGKNGRHASRVGRTVHHQNHIFHLHYLGWNFSSDRSDATSRCSLIAWRPGCRTQGSLPFSNVPAHKPPGVGMSRPPPRDRNTGSPRQSVWNLRANGASLATIWSRSSSAR